MKIKKLNKALKSSIKKKYVKKEELEKLGKEVKKLQKKIRQLESRLASGSTEQAAPSGKKNKPGKKAQTAAEAPGATAGADKLTRIRGIGPVIEKKLHDLGVTTFSQIANWSEEEIETVSANLSFKGRIEREEWVSQARELVDS